MQVLTANRLDDGRVVFLAEDGRWSPRLDAARLARDDATAAELESLGAAAERACRVVGSYLIPVTAGDGTIEATTARERIRARGPSVQTSAA
jgi:hypothetical protein